MNFLKKKSFESVREAGSSSGLDKTLSAFDLVLLGLGAIVGTGVFTLTGLVAAQYSG
ncbi:MAG: amino acid permease, partial [Rickettsiales bacterium]